VILTQTFYELPEGGAVVGGWNVPDAKRQKISPVYKEKVGNRYLNRSVSISTSTVSLFSLRQKKRCNPFLDCINSCNLELSRI